MSSDSGDAQMANGGNGTDPSVHVTSESLKLRRHLGLVSAASYVTGGIIGVGIFVSPQSVLLSVGRAPGVALCVWAFCAFTNLCGALVYAEYGSRIRKSGGSYTYIREGYGDVAGFVFLWTQFVVARPMAIALGAMTAAEYVLRPVFLDCPGLTPRAAKVLIALSILGAVVVVNSYDTRLGAHIQTVSTACKVAALIVINVIGIIFLAGEDGSANLQDMFRPTEPITVAGVTLAIYSCNYAYVGWDNLNNGVEEVKNPKRNIPLAILLSMTIVTVCYLLAIVSYHAVLTTTQIVSGVAVAVIFLKVTVPIMTLFAVPCIGISASGIVNTVIFTSTRLNFIGGRDGLFPEALSMVSVSRRTPLVAVILLGVMTSITILLGDITSVLASYIFFRAAGETVAILGFYRIRRKFPATQDTFVAPTAFPLIYLAVNLPLMVVALTQDTSRYVIPLVLCLLGVPSYYASKSDACKRGPFRRLNDFLVKVSHRLLLCDFASKNY